MIGDGLLERLPAYLAEWCPAARYAVITDSAVGALFGEAVRAAIGTLAPVEVISFPAGEWNKTRETWAQLTDQLLARGFGRDSAVVALGGGVTGDLAGFVAATYMRGVPYVQVPTSLLAMIDSSIGGKTGIDVPAGKNLVGAFHQPRGVLADLATLRSLPPLHFAAGMAEAIKHGAIADAAYFAWIETNRERIRAHAPEALAELVRRSVELKARIVAADERESGMRAILNFGHTVAHALEAVSGYELMHGEAVAIGMAAEARLGTEAGLTSERALQRLLGLLVAFDLPIGFEPVAIEKLLGAMESDKKKRAEGLRFALLKEIGEMARGPKGEWTVALPNGFVAERLQGVLESRG